MKREELTDLEASAIRHADALLTHWDSGEGTAETLAAAHAYAALALAVGQRVARVDGYR